MADVNWINEASEAATLLFKPNEHCVGEDIRFALENQGIHPRHHNAWGSLIRVMKKKGLLVETGQWRPMEAKKSNGRLTPIYRFAGAL